MVHRNRPPGPFSFFLSSAGFIISEVHPAVNAPFDLHGYVDYVSEHQIDDPETIPDEIMKGFFANAEGNTSEAS